MGFVTKAVPDGAKRTIVLVVLAFFCLQLSRFYLVLELNSSGCFDGHERHASVAGDDGHHDDGEEALPAGQANGPFLRHCKDVFDGVGLTVAQPLALPIAVSHPGPATAWAGFIEPKNLTVQNYLPPPFQPPRTPR